MPDRNAIPSRADNHCRRCNGDGFIIVTGNESLGQTGYRFTCPDCSVGPLGAGLVDFEPVDLFAGFRLCEECGAMVAVDMTDKHTEWHEEIGA